MPKLFSARYSVLVFLCLYVAVANAQDNVPTHPVDGTFIKEWLVLGPFFPEDLETDFLASANGEAFVNAKPGDTVTTAEGKTLTWAVYRSPEIIVNLQHALGRHEQAVCYVFCLLESDKGGDAEILVGSDDGVVVFLNGQRVHTYLVGRSVIVDGDRVAVSLRPGKNRCLVKISNGIQDWGLTMRVFPPTRAVIAGVITDKAGKTLSNAIVRLWQGSTLIAKTETDSKGSYQFSAYPASGHYDIEATHGTKGNWEIGVQLSAGARVNMNLMLQNAVSVTGHLLAFDDSAHPGVLVEASLLGEDGTSQRRVTTFSDKKGRYAFINLIAGLYQLRCYSPGTDSDNPNTIVSVGAEKTLENVDFRFPPFKHGIWENYTYLDGLANNHVLAIHQDREGFLWFGTDGGVSRYDGDKFVNFTTDDGLANNSVSAVYQDREGFFWFGTWGGVSRYDGKAFVNFTTDDGLASNFVTVIHQDREGHFWFGTWGGVSRYDGKAFVNFTTDDGLASNFVTVIHQDREGHFWFGTWDGGVSRYDGRELVNFTTANGLASDFVRAIHQDQEGFLWFGTLGGVSRYNGNAFVNFTINDGLADNFVRAIHQDREGFLWFGTNNGGVSRYNGNAFVNFTTNNGLASNSVSVIHQSREGFLWFGTDGGGVSQYNGSEFVSFTTADGLQNNSVYSILQDQEGFLWFGTDGGVSQYNDSEFVSFTTANGLASDFVRVIHQDREGFLWFGALGGVSRYDGKVFVNFSTHDGLANNVVPAIHQDREGFLWFGTLGGISRYDGKAFVNFTTDEGLAYNVVLTIHQDREGSLWFGTSRGVSRYDGKAFVNFSTHDGLANNFVQMIRQDREGFLWFGTSGGVFRYDGKAFVNFSAEDGLAQNDVTPIYQDREGTLWFGTDGGGVSRYDGTSWTSLDTRDGLINNRVWGICQDSDETLWFGTSEGVTQYRPNQVSPSVRIVSVQSHNTSMGLIPQTAPEVPGLEIAGVCISARTVSGDFFDYVPLGNGMLAVVLADVTGKGMKGAMNAVLSSGALHSEAKFGVSPSQMLRALNRNLYPRFQQYTNCAMAILTIDPKGKTLKYANAGIPYPIIKRGEDDIEELSLNGLPLGAFKSSEYQETPPIELKSGNLIILFSDGITEAFGRDNPEQLYMETDRLADLIKGLDKTMNAEAVIDAIINDVRDFSGDAQQNDDMTIVVIKAL